jgi:hypothetical protein
MTPEIAVDGVNNGDLETFILINLCESPIEHITSDHLYGLTTKSRDVFSLLYSLTRQVVRIMCVCYVFVDILGKSS